MAPPPPTAAEPAAKRIAFVVYRGIQSLDLAGPFEVFAGANEVLEYRNKAPAYELTVLASSRESMWATLMIGTCEFTPMLVGRMLPSKTNRLQRC